MTINEEICFNLETIKIMADGVAKKVNSTCAPADLCYIEQIVSIVLNHLDTILTTKTDEAFADDNTTADPDDTLPLCKSCGNIVETDENFCPSCGKKQT